MIYLLRDGVLVPKGSVRDARASSVRADFPTPRLSKLEPYASPIDGHEVTSWGERDRELQANNAYDPRDFNERPKPKPKQLDLPFDS